MKRKFMDMKKCVTKKHREEGRKGREKRKR